MPPLTHVAFALAGGLAGFLWHRLDLHSRAARRYRQLTTGSVSGVRVVVVGGGFAGLAAATTLGRAGLFGAPVVPTLVDHHNFNTWSPLLYQVVTGSVDPSRVDYPLRLAGRDHGFLFREAELTGVDFDRNVVRLDDGDLPYDYLILALGSVPNYFGLADVAEQALPLKWGGKAVAIHNRVIEAFERADVEPSADRRRALLTICVVGAGATGIGLIGSLHDLISETLLPQYPRLDPSEVSLVLVEARDHFLDGSPRKMSDLAREHFARLRSPSVDVRLGACVAGASAGTLLFADGSRLRSATIIWTAGVRANPLAESVDADRARDGRVIVGADLALPRHPEVFVVGDLASVTEPASRRPLPPNAQVAIQTGRAAAENVLRRVRGQPARAFRYRDYGDAVPIGSDKAVAVIGGVVLDGLLAHLVRRGIYVRNLVGVKNRLGVLLDWAAEITGRRNIVEFEGPHPAISGQFAEEARPLERPLVCPIDEVAPSAGEERRAA